MKAQDFSLPDEQGEYHKLSDYLGKWVILYFYPKDNTSGCTTEACNFRDNFRLFEEQGVVILGVSKDSIASHKKFSIKYHFPFRILSDEKGDIIKSYGAWGKKKFLGKLFSGTLRKTFIIDPEGEIRKIYEKVNPEEHAKQILQDLKLLH